MKALTYRGVRRIRYEDVPDPSIEDDHDAIVRVELAGICGSDLHVYHGREVVDDGTIMGHEFVGSVAETGAGVRAFHRGDRVMCPFTTSCGRCFYCSTGLSARCTQGRLFGAIEKARGLHGGQAELVRVPLADTTLCRIPDDMSHEEALLLCDILPTGHHCATMARVAPNTTAVVIGCGPVGLMTIVAARALGADRLYAVDTVAERLSLAARFGAHTVHACHENPIDVIRSATEGRGADAVLEAVGSGDAGRLAFELVRPGGTISVVGVHHEASFAFSPAQAYDKNLTYRIGRSPVRSLMEDLVPLVRRRGRELASVFTHRLPLSEGPAAYEMFDLKTDGCIKVALVP
jgi:threonine dehydrogenase-like Zn-dependent dehydrogenase